MSAVQADMKRKRKHKPDLDDVIRLLNVALRRMKNMPTIAEVKAAVQAAVGEEAAQVAARLKALEDRIAELEVGATITDADRDELVAMVQSVFTPSA